MAATTMGGLSSAATDPKNDIMGAPTGMLSAPNETTVAPSAAPVPDPKASMLSDWYQSYMAKSPTTKDATASQAGTATWTPGKDSTVQGQLTNVLDAGGPLMDRATTRANQQANSRGLLNTSIAVGAGQSALYDAALPIAQQDANTNAQAGQFNANASNAAALTNAGLATDVSKTNAGAANSATAAQSAAGVGSFQQGQQIEAQKQIQVNDIANQKAMQLAQLGSAATLQDKQLAVQQLMQQTGITAQQAQQALDIANQQQMQKAGFTQQAALQESQNTFQERIQKLQESGMDSRQANQLAVQESLAKLSELGVNNRFDAQQALQSSQFNMEQLALDRRQLVQNQQQLDAMNLQAKLNRQDVPTAYAANLAASTMQSVNAIMADPNLSSEKGPNGEPSPKQNAMQNVVDFANSTMDWAAKFYGTAFPPVTMPGAAPATAPGQATPVADAPAPQSPTTGLYSTIPRLAQTMQP